MTSTSGRVGTTCPSCSPDAPTPHEVLSEGGQATVRCVECDHVHKTAVEDRTVDRDVVVSQEGDSFTATVEVPPDETLETGDEFVVESDEGIFTVRITSLELGSDRRTERAPAEEVVTIWTRDIGNVVVNVTLHPHERSYEETRSLEVHLPGDHELVIGEPESLGGERFEVEQIRLRDHAVGNEDPNLDRPGRTAQAKDVKRLYARDETGGVRRNPWTGW